MKNGLIGLLLAAAFALAFWVLNRDAESSRQSVVAPSPGTTVTLTLAEADIQRTRVETVGTAEARRSVLLYAPSAGEVTAVTFKPGDRIEANAVLLELDARDEQLALDLAESRLRDAERTMSRYDRAGERAAFTETQLDQARIAVEEARIARDRARVALDDRTLEAPFDGIIGLTTIDPGDRITTTTPVATLDDRSLLRVRFGVPEAFLGQIAIGDPVQLEPWSGRAVEAEARIIDIDSQVDPATRTFTVRAALANDDDRWRPGMGFRVALELTGREYARVPELALQWGGDGAYVWTVDDAGTAARREVQLIQRDRGSVLIDGVAPGEAVVLEGVQKMSEGRLVEVIDAAELDARTAVRAALEPQP